MKYQVFFPAIAGGEQEKYFFLSDKPRGMLANLE
jgi:hypothetical protein